MMLGFWAGKARAHRHEEAFQAYVAEHFPELPAPEEVLVAGEPGDAKRFRALLVSPERQEVILLFDQGRDGITHRAYPFTTLTSVDSTSRIIRRGPPTQRIYSYEQTMTVGFADGTAVPFSLEMISNKYGSDKAPGLVAAVLAPWEEQLKGLVGLQAASTPATPAAGAAADWYPDPVGRHEVRYWDGRAWTANVADQGTPAADPLDAAA